jgi:hypothetical protein
MSETNRLPIIRILTLVAGLMPFAAAPRSVAQLQYSSPTDYSVGTSPLGVVVADFNRDGKQDVAVVNSGDQNLSIMLGNGDGTFQPAVNYACGSTPGVLAVGDFNGDGYLDLAVANGSANAVSILLNNGDGTFQVPIQYDAGTSDDYVAVADFNNDKKMDLLVSSAGTGLSILLGNGDGTFQAPAIITPGGSPVIIADINGDGKVDIVTGSAVLLGNGDGTFAPPTQLILTTNGHAIKVNFWAAGDFNGDGKADLALEGSTLSCVVYKNKEICTTQTGVWTMLGNGDGTFGALSLVGVIASGECGFGGCDGTWELAQFLTVADTNNDGKLDLVVMDSGVQRCSNSLCGELASVLVGVGNGNGTFLLTGFPLGSVPNWVAVGDFNNDTLLDVVATGSPLGNLPGNLISVLLNTTPSSELSLTLAGNGEGSVASQPPVMNCTSSCSGNFAPGTTVTLTAAANAMSVFTGWGGACTGTGTCTIPMNAAASLTATFTALFPLSVALLGSGGGTVSSTPAGINCGSACQANFLSGTSVTLSATPNSTSNFTGWSGACSGTGACSVVVNAAASATATFALQDFSLTSASSALTVQPGGHGADVMTIAGVNGPFTTAIQLTCAVAGPAPMPACAFSATSVTPGSSSVTSTLTITAPTLATTQMPSSRSQLSRSLYALWLPLMLGIAGVGGRQKQRHQFGLFRGLLLLLMLQMACGGNSSSSHTTPPPTSYTIAVTGASGAIQHSTQITVTVQ